MERLRPRCKTVVTEEVAWACYKSDFTQVFADVVALLAQKPDKTAVVKLTPDRHLRGHGDRSPSGSQGERRGQYAQAGPSSICRRSEMRCALPLRSVTPITSGGAEALTTARP